LYAGFPNLCWILRAFSLLCASLALLGLQPAYALRIQLRARTDLRLQATQEAAGLRLRGQLSDSRGAPVGGAAVVFAVVTGQGPTVDLQAMTNESGLFDALVARDRLPEAADLVHVEARFGGDPRLGESTAATTLDVQKLEAAIELHLETDRVAADAAPLEALLDVRSGELPIPGAPVQILIDGRALVLVRTAGDGHARASIPIEQLGQPGRHVVQAAVLPSEQFNEASAAARVEVHMGLAVELHVRPGSAGQTCALGDWCLQGSVSLLSAQGPEPAPDCAISLHADRHLLGNLVSNADGRFAGVLRGAFVASLFAPGAVGLVAQAQSQQAFIDVGWSPIAVLDVPFPPQLSGWFYGVPVLLLLGVTLLQRWRARRRERALLVRSEATSAGLPSEAVRRTSEVALPSCTLRGTILHGETGRPTPGTLTLQPFTATTLADPRCIHCPDGWFDTGELPTGRYLLRVACQEHEELLLPVDLPHDGTFDGCELLPSSCRAIVRGSFAAALRRWTGRGVDWTSETPRDVEPRWASAARRGQGEIREAIRRVDRALYGARTESPEVRSARQAIHRVSEVQR